jgi:leader peptidase (prepilin peptidase) / N-methyltransferase
MLAELLVGWTLLTLAWIDVEQFRLPDALTLPLLGAGLVATEVTAPDALGDHLIGAAVGYLAFRTVRNAYRTVRRKDGLGLGDAKLLSAAGAWLGWALLPDVVFGAALLGVVRFVSAG